MSIPRDKLYTGDVNRRALEPQPRGPIGLYDTTLRDGEQTVGVVLDPEQKLEIARLLDGLGIERIEAGFPRVSEDDARAIRLIADAGLDAEVWGFSRAVQADVEALVELGVRFAVIESPLSDLKLRAYGIERDEMLKRIHNAVTFAAQHDITVAYFGVDGTRAELGFLQQAYETAIAAGAKEAVVVDTLGIATPEAAAFLVGHVSEWVDVPVHWHGHNDFGLATAAAVAAVQAGATWMQGTINGMGERAGNANLGEVALTLDALYGIRTNLRFERLRDGVRPRAGDLGLRARAVEAGRRGHAVPPRVRARSRRSSTIRPRSSPTPPTSSARTGRSCSARSPASTRSASRPRSSGSTCRRAIARRCSRASNGLGADKRGLVTDDEFRQLADATLVR